ncbi:MAG: hypothetical protein ACFB0D_15260 [Phormidesmis sp.]
MTVAMLLLLCIVTVGCATVETTGGGTDNSTENTQLEQELPTDPEQSEETSVSQETPPTEIQQAVLKEVGKQQNVAPEQLQITAANAADWSDACLGLAGLGEMCAAVITPGWAMTITDGQQRWQYRADLEARQVRLEK